MTRLLALCFLSLAAREGVCQQQPPRAYPSAEWRTMARLAADGRIEIVSRKPRGEVRFRIKPEDGTPVLALAMSKNEELLAYSQEEVVIVFDITKAKVVKRIPFEKATLLEFSAERGILYLENDRRQCDIVPIP